MAENYNDRDRRSGQRRNPSGANGHRPSNTGARSSSQRPASQRNRTQDGRPARRPRTDSGRAQQQRQRQSAPSRAGGAARSGRTERSRRTPAYGSNRGTGRGRGREIYAGGNPASRGGFTLFGIELPPWTPIAAIAAIILIVIVLAVRGCGGSAEPEQDATNTASVSIAETSPAAASSGTSAQGSVSAQGSTSSQSGTSAQVSSAAQGSSQESAQGAGSTATPHLNTALVVKTAQAGADFGRRARAGNFSISFSTTGDIMFGREVSTFVDENGGAATLANVADALSAADVTIANLECPLTDDESEALIGKDVLWRSNPKGIDGLKTTGIDIVSLANNHIMDYGGTGLSDTLKALDGAGILHAGAGMTEKDAEKIVETTVDGVSIAFFSWTDIIPDNFMAFGDSPGVVSARLAMDDACKRVAEAKKTHDIVIVAMHWGVEYQEYIDSALQEEPAHKLVDAGADVVWGNHPHVIEGIEFYKDSLISYSQGDFVCDHYSQETGESFILDFDITPDGIQNVTATPVYLDDTYGIPSIVTGDEADNILGRLERISEGMNTKFDVQDYVAHITPAA